MALSQPGQRKWRGASCRVLPGGYNYRNKNNEPAKNLGNEPLHALGAILLSLLLVGCDNSVAQNAAPLRPPSMLLMWL
jgi:multidrug efflux system membrane fusion protein